MILRRRPRLLCYGHDGMLLYTRKLILEAEFSVERCEELSGLAEVLSRGRVDLVLVCHSVPQEECAEVIEKVRAESPAVKVLALQESLGGACSAHSDATMDNLEGPPALLHEIHALLGMATGENEITDGSSRGKIVSFSDFQSAHRPA
jgi:DNA-binding response OmpR family regulator